jgi:hypothetical protein
VEEGGGPWGSSPSLKESGVLAAAQNALFPGSHSDFYLPEPEITDFSKFRHLDVMELSNQTLYPH